MDAHSPLVTILLPTYQCEAYVGECLRSLLEQTFTDYELLVIDDASTDGTVAVIQSFKDPRLRLIRKPQNSGYTDSLNEGMRIARGVYIARMDADDVALPQRLQKQVQFLDDHPGVVLCGTWYKEIPGDHVAELPVAHEAIKVGMLTANSICHPSVLFRKDFFLSHRLFYNRAFESAEDYELWTQLIGLGKVHNLPEVLVHYRLHPQQVTTQRNAFLLGRAAVCRLQLLRYVSPNFSDDEQDLLLWLLAGKRLRSGSEVVKAVKLLDSLALQNTAKGFYEDAGFRAFAAAEKQQLLWNFVVFHHRYSPGLFLQLWGLKEMRTSLSRAERRRFAVKCLLFRRVPPGAVRHSRVVR